MDIQTQILSLLAQWSTTHPPPDALGETTLQQIKFVKTTHESVHGDGMSQNSTQGTHMLCVVLTCVLE